MSIYMLIVFFIVVALIVYNRTSSMRFQAIYDLNGKRLGWLSYNKRQFILEEVVDGKIKLSEKEEWGQVQISIENNFYKKSAKHMALDLKRRIIVNQGNIQEAQSEIAPGFVTQALRLNEHLVQQRILAFQKYFLIISRQSKGDLGTESPLGGLKFIWRSAR